MKSINWNKASELGLIEKINREMLHPLGLALSRNPETGASDGLLISDDGVWEYSHDMQNNAATDESIREFVANAYKNVDLD